MIESSQQTPVAAGDAKDQKPAEPDAAANQSRRETVVTVGTLVLVGIAVVGLALIWSVMTWGRRLRRFARQVPKPTVVDELWYLKANKSKPGLPPDHHDKPGPATGESNPA